MKKVIVYFSFSLFLLIFITVGYASLEASLSISGDLVYRADSDIRITNMTLLSSENDGMEIYNAKYKINTISTGVVIPYSNSHVTYQIEVTNKSNKDKRISRLINVLDNNSNVNYTINGYNLDDKINANSTITFTITFNCSSSLGNTNIDEMTLGFRFRDYEPSVLMQASSSGDGSTAFLDGSITRNSIESVSFINNNVVPNNAIGFYDVSSSQDETILLWYLDQDNNGLNEVYIGSEDGVVYTNPNSSYLFYYLENLKSISYDNVSFSKTTNMNYLFSHCSSIDGNFVNTFIDNFSSSISAYEMFSYCNSIDRIEINNIPIADRMFYSSNNLTDIVLGSNVSSIGNMAFYYTQSGKLTTYINGSCTALLNYVFNSDKRIPFIVDTRTRPYVLIDNDETSILERDTRLGSYSEDSKGNQWVWVVVPQTTEVYSTTGLGVTDFTDAVYSSIETDLQNYASLYRNGTGHKDAWINTSINGISSANYTQYKKDSLKSIYKYGGFYMARFEAGTRTARTSGNNTLTEPLSVRDVYPYNYITQANAQIQSLTMAPNSNYLTVDYYGFEWDLLAKFVETYATELGSDISTRRTKASNDCHEFGNFTGSNTVPVEFTVSRGKYNTDPKNNAAWNNITGSYTKSNASKAMFTTGASERNKILNLYDIMGNAGEYSSETYYLTIFITLNYGALRGGYYDSTSVSYMNFIRRDYYISMADGAHSFRVSLHKNN